MDSKISALRPRGTCALTTPRFDNRLGFRAANAGSLRVILGLLVAGCGGAESELVEDVTAEDGVVETEPARTGKVTQPVIDNTFAVGVIPIGPGFGENQLYGTTCPADSPLVTIYMDDEDAGGGLTPNGTNETQFSPWVSSTTARGQTPFYWAVWPNGFNTLLRYCKVDGRRFFPLTTSVNDKGRFYAVLKLGSVCPNGSLEFTRYIDNEDSSNENSRSGPIAPNVSNVNTTLKFCFFRSGSNIATDVPDIGVAYAVYHDFDGAQPFPFIFGKAWHTSDDEDNNNENSLSPDSTAASFDFQTIIGVGHNTFYELGRVF